MTLEERKTYSTTLTKNELLYLSDQFSLFTPWPDNMDSSPDDLLRKAGRAYLELEGDATKGTIEVYLTLDELWMAREIAKSSAMLGPDKVGMTLLKKAYTGIFALEDEGEVLSDEFVPQELPDFMKRTDWND